MPQIGKNAIQIPMPNASAMRCGVSSTWSSSLAAFAIRFRRRLPA
jgi:hypothetical protein